jgi:hypothetical protein
MDKTLYTRYTEDFYPALNFGPLGGIKNQNEWIKESRSEVVTLGLLEDGIIVFLRDGFSRRFHITLFAYHQNSLFPPRWA